MPVILAFGTGHNPSGAAGVATVVFAVLIIVAAVTVVVLKARRR